MLSILKNSLVTGVSQQDVMIRKKELDWLSRNYWIIATQATVVAGFSFRQLTSSLPHNISWMTLFIYIVLIVSTLVISLYVVVTATFASILAPGLALRGTSGFESINFAIDYLRKYQEKTLCCFVLGLTTFVLSSFLVIFIIGRGTDAAIRAEILLFGTTVVMFVAASRITMKLYHDKTAPSGVAVLENTYQLIGDLDAATTTPYNMHSNSPSQDGH